MRNMSEIVARSSLLEVAAFAKQRGRKNLLEKIDKEYMESLLQKGGDMPLQPLLAEYCIATTHALTECAKWLSHHYNRRLADLLSDPSRICTGSVAYSLNEYLELWELVPVNDRNTLMAKLVQFLGACVKREAVSSRKKLLSVAWQLSCTYKNKILQDVIAAFCRDPDNKYYREIAWPTLPTKLRTHMSAT